MFDPLRTTTLPIWRQDHAAYAAFYAPGCLCVVARSDADRFADALVSGERSGGFTQGYPLGSQLGILWDAGHLAEASTPEACPQTEKRPGRRPLGAPETATYQVDWVAELCRSARQALAGSTRSESEPFVPECLSLYLNNECNLHCAYCYADPSRMPAPRLEQDAIAAAAQVVAGHCRHEERPFYVVFHGGGEPTLHRERVDAALDLLERVASAHEIRPFRYIATNGVLSEDKAAWLARRFDLVGLSCDGPADVQDHQRPRWDGGSTSDTVEQTARVLREEGCAFHVRATITRWTLRRQAEIAAYICQALGPAEIRFEPVYAGRRSTGDTAIGADQAGAFVARLRSAQEVARRYGVPLGTSMSRPNSIHGPYCNVFRAVLNLVPGGVATACFAVTEAKQARDKGMAIGALDPVDGRFAVDGARVQALRERLSVLPADCAGCLNRFHCVRGCPDVCPLDRDSGDGLAASFRCRAARALAEASLTAAGEALWAGGRGAFAGGVGVHTLAAF